MYKGIIKDTFTPVIIEKLKTYGIDVTSHIVVDDGMENIERAIEELKKKGLDMILCTGGMSVDPDDNTPGAIKNSGAEIVTYGAPVLPGAMFLLGYYDNGMPVMGLPGCVMYAGATVFDLVLPKIAAGIKVTKKDVVKMGNGGLCLGCSECRISRSVPLANKILMGGKTNEKNFMLNSVCRPCGRCDFRLLKLIKGARNE